VTVTNKLRDEAEKAKRVSAFAGYKICENPCCEDIEMWKEIKEVATALLAFKGEDELPDCPICGKQVAIICPDDLKRLQDKAGGVTVEEIILEDWKKHPYMKLSPVEGCTCVCCKEAKALQDKGGKNG